MAVIFGWECTSELWTQNIPGLNPISAVHATHRFPVVQAPTHRGVFLLRWGSHLPPMSRDLLPHFLVLNEFAGSLPFTATSHLPHILEILLNLNFYISSVNRKRRLSYSYGETRPPCPLDPKWGSWNLMTHLTSAQTFLYSFLITLSQIRTWTLLTVLGRNVHWICIHKRLNLETLVMCITI